MSLYTIEEELLLILSEIEENEGEVSEELFAKLNITKENLHQKLDNYVKAVKSFNGDVVTIKDEIKRLQANAKVKDNRVERLKKAMLGAVQLFGYDGKSGNKVIDLPTVKLFTKGSKAVNTDETRINKLISEFERFVRELVDNDILYTGSDVELQAVLDAINANLKAEWNLDKENRFFNNVEEDFIPYTLTDLTTLKIEITTTQTIYDLFRTGKEALVLYGKNPINTQMRNHTAKGDWESAIKVADSINNDHSDEEDYVPLSYPTVAKIVENTSIQIK